MHVQLSTEDRQAIDLLLDQGLSPQATSSGRAGFAPPSPDDIRIRLARVNDLLSLLRTMPAVDPPADLVARTLQFVENAPAAAPDYEPAVTYRIDSHSA
jgi:hypothetical protein